MTRSSHMLDLRRTRAQGVCRHCSRGRITTAFVPAGGAGAMNVEWEHQRQWARVNSAVDVPLRRGAWYRVVAPVTRVEVVVSVQGKRVSVPRAAVETSSPPPHEWTVVEDPTVAADRTPAIFRLRFLVCPACRNRLVVPASRLAGQLFPRYSP